MRVIDLRRHTLAARKRQNGHETKQTAVTKFKFRIRMKYLRRNVDLETDYKKAGKPRNGFVSGIFYLHRHIQCQVFCKKCCFIGINYYNYFIT